MRHGSNYSIHDKQRRLLGRGRFPYAYLAIVAVVGLVLAMAFGHAVGKTSLGGASDNPLRTIKLYVDNNRAVTVLAKQYAADGNSRDAKLLDRIASQPGTTWLIGPSDGDPMATKDIALVTRTSSEAAAQGTVPVYELYAIPNRDACADGSSKGGFATGQQYLLWLDQIIAALKTDAVFSVEADAIAHTIHDKCMTIQQVSERYRLLRTAMSSLSGAPHVRAVYLDAGHSEWFPDPSVLVGPLQQSGIQQARGVAVNVSFFVATPEITKWSQKLVGLLGGNKGVIIDTSRNGKGVPPKTVTGEARWCNPAGRGLGQPPTSLVADRHIDAHLWLKNNGESDGACFGNPPAGVFYPAAALELARNAAAG